ncbi:type 1 glutamine amidotransferase-like domain-containing protein [Rhizobium sp. P40RR-XXII]|uniref:Type 1 glutamine amidotransferase-like domain-containing protein n=1 Tax=unclassified Rhizobium TaxID=2613769 RepID=UPI001456A1F9|nr:MULTISPECIES: Type 1 glutamine amidotransferase-like domain-containing protein [unclassified Rhizobium]NLR86952.1 type 1 glutamine amidotransferase-like domain-containing protein [Rhizobium sp. P28RR-XV]NLS18027.1 type 1 glutamine amidotransferase-like domain-containing protein [Rhizobium sp. P40RR-XXII]
MVNLVFYSDQIIPENRRVDLKLLSMMATLKLGKRIGYIPSGLEPDRRFFNERRQYYDAHGLEMSLFYDPEGASAVEEREALFACDGIHLTGGRTAGYLQRLRRSEMLPLLRDWALGGGVLIGTSAGAILMTPTIATDALFTGEMPEALSKETALDLVPFEFFPHLNEKPSYLNELIRYSKFTSRPILACNDGDGIVVSNGRADSIGKPVWIADGEVRHANDITLEGLVLSHNS